MDYRIIDFPKINDPRGNLTFLQNPDQLPFEIKRVFLTYDVPAGATRGGHAYRTQEELIISLSGSFDIALMDRNGNKKVVQLNRSYFGLYIPPNTWRHLENFSTNSVALHLSSSLYNENDYIRELNNYFHG